jgi:glycerol-3-phosphate dehydrogenase
MRGKDDVLDLLIIGGGINGAGIAADAAGRGLQVGLYEAADYASATSSASSKLIHGGLRYLEHYDFRLVAEALAEREVILAKAPHLVRPMRFRLPHRPHLRPAWMIRAGLFLYDRLGKRTTLPASCPLNLAKTHLLKPDIRVGFEYSDCWADDARLVLANVLAAQDQGAEARNYCRVVRAIRDGLTWRVTMKDMRTDEAFERQARALVNAAGPWVTDVFDEALKLPSPRGIRLIKGSHIVVPKLYSDPEAFILQNTDHRVVFVIPYLDEYSLIGTTDVQYQGDPRLVEMEPAERDYLLDVVNDYFIQQINERDIVWSFSGVRPLCDDESDSPQAMTRDYTLELEGGPRHAPLLSVFGGKLTTYRRLAQAALSQLKPFLPAMGPAWTATAALPGGDFSGSCGALSQTLQADFPWLDAQTALRFVHAYGSRTRTLLLAGIGSEAQMGPLFAPGVYERELRYLVDHEQARCVDDILWRRSKLGLRLNKAQRIQIGEFLTGYLKQGSSSLKAD